MMATTQSPTIYLSQERDFWGNLKRDLQELRGVSTLVYELIQNADDVKKLDGNSHGASHIVFDVCDDKLIVWNDGIFSSCGALEVQECPWKLTRGYRCDFHRMKQVGGGDKRNQYNNTGAFGIGFNAVYQITDHPEIISNGWHWQLHPENERDKRIEGVQVTGTVGTKLILPWAFDSRSAVRKELPGCPAISPNQIDGFADEIKAALPKAAIFLKQVTLLELHRNGRPIQRITRTVGSDKIELDLNGDKIGWKIFRGDFAESAAELREIHKGAIEETRRSVVTIAVPDSLFVEGFLFADLPTEMQTHLPFHIAADFYPSADRKRILLDDSISGKWNRLTIRSAARLMADSFDQLIKPFGPIECWEWVSKVYKGGKSNPLDSAFLAFWQELAEILPTKRILLTAEETFTFVNSAYLLESDEELDATDVWEGLEIKVVHPALRQYFGLLLELNTRRLRLSDIAGAFHNKKLSGTFAFQQMPKALQSISGFQRMWKAINLIWNARNRSSNDERQLVSRQFSSSAVAVSKDGYVHSPDLLFKGDTAIQGIFPQLHWWQADLVESDPIPSKLIPDFTVAEAVSYLSSWPAEEIQRRWLDKSFSIKEFYYWLELHREEVLANASLAASLKQLAIWPAGGQLHPLTKLYLSGGFEDPLHLASVIDTSALGGRTEFLRVGLKIKSLDFLTYIREQIPQAIVSMENGAADVRIQLIYELALRLGEIRDYEDIRYILQKLPLIHCKDDHYYPSKQVYFDNDLTRVLGNNIKMASPQKEHAQAVEHLYEWLGVAREPRYEDILSRIEAIAESTPTAEARHLVQELFSYLGKHWKVISQSDSTAKRQFEQFFAKLKRIRWLPGSRYPNQWCSPDTLFATFNKTLFESQGNFLEFPLVVQQDAAAFIDLIGLNRSPLPIHIIRHILYCAERNILVSLEVYRVLSYKDNLADVIALNELDGKPCLLVSETPVQYARPDQVFWNDHPFGPYRFKIGQGLLPYAELLSKLGVRAEPEIGDFIQVIMDISTEYRNNPLDEIALTIIMKCWRRLSEALSSGDIETSVLKEKLGDKKVIPDPRAMLSMPTNMFFEDRAGLASRFDALLRNNVLQRTENCWLAMEAVGVELLSKIVQVDLAGEVDAQEDRNLPKLISERKLLIQRVIDAERIHGADIGSYDRLSSLDFRRVEQLDIVMSVYAFNRRYSADPEGTNALLKDEVFYSVWTNDGPSWAAIGRELALAIKSSGEIGSLAMGLKEVLSAPTFQVASASLDELNYPPLQGSESASEEIQSLVVDWPMTEETPTSDLLETPSPSSGDIQSPSIGGNERREVRKPKPRRRTSRIITYVYPDGGLQDADESDPDLVRRRTAVEKTGVARVIEYEEKYHRQAIDKNETVANHPGYDLESTDSETGATRYIEVKSLSGYWDSSSPVLMTKTEFQAAKEKRDEYWLYVVERTSADDCRIYCIQNPANRAQYYVFDHGWEPLSVD